MVTRVDPVVASPSPPRPSLTLRRRARLLQVPCDRIEYLKADGDYVVIQAVDASIRLHASLGRLLAELPGDRFARVHRSLVLNLQRVAEVYVPRPGRFAVRLESGITFPVSRSRVKTLRDRLRSHPALSADTGALASN